MMMITIVRWNTLLWPYMDVTLVFFHVFLMYNKINKKKILESIKGLTYVKLTPSKNEKKIKIMDIQ